MSVDLLSTTVDKGRALMTTDAQTTSRQGANYENFLNLGGGVNSSDLIDNF
jgi:hypothetical protein